MTEKTHYRKAFNSPYLSSADIIEPTILKISRVRLEPDKTKKTKDLFNTAYFVEKEIRPGEELKPMILNAGNSRTMKKLTGSAFIEDWNDIAVTIYVDQNVRFGRDTVEGLRISSEFPRTEHPELLPSNKTAWGRAIKAYERDGNFDTIEKHMTLSDENKFLIKYHKEIEAYRRDKHFGTIPHIDKISETDKFKIVDLALPDKKE